MRYTIYESGITGPSANIGGSSDYHIDSKFSTKLGEEEARRRFEEKVKKYNSLGRVVEFSNEGVADEIYDMSLSDDKRAELFRRAYGAHAPREGYYSLDYYAPIKGNNRWHKSVEGAPIFAVGIEGGRRETGTGGDYGFYSIMYDKDGNITGKVGHGDIRYPNTSSITTSPAVEVQEPSQMDYSNMTKKQLDAEYDKIRMAGDIFKAKEEGMKMHRAFFNK